ncbi:hypothetical protein BD626DRAFT_558654 [Schizophyllum amplum]|uniref:Uncharacterized protein n=1 Tax=Schizophyllum amplum TaxID=97359 RepID=A0A550C8Z8_9AGAR|nr:hypothetical protein BD626DRAFT_558654 [Auriculariopsis ampla]
MSLLHFRVLLPGGADADHDSSRATTDVPQNDMPPPPPPPPPPPAPPPRTLEPTRSGRARKFPQKYKDFRPTEFVASIIPDSVELPDIPEVVLPETAVDQTTTEPEVLSRDVENAPTPLPGTLPPELAKHLDNDGFLNYPEDAFGTWRSYPGIPTYIPPAESEAADLCDGPGFKKPHPSEAAGLGAPSDTARAESSIKITNITPFDNITVFRLMSWWYGSKGNLSLKLLNDLVHDVMLQPDFDPAHLEGFSAEKEMKRMDAHRRLTGAKDGWRNGTVKLSLPCEKAKHDAEANAPVLEINTVRYRPLIEVIRTAFEQPGAKFMHLFPYRLFHRPRPDADPSPIIEEIYNTPAVLEEHQAVQSIPFEAGTPPEHLAVESIILPICPYSDATSLAQFGNTSLWPIYIWFGNVSNSFSAMHVAYMPTLPDDLQDEYAKHFGKNASPATMTFLKRELFQGVWELLIDDDFVHAYKHGIILKCIDGIYRRIFPRFFSYSADYPEKVLLSSIKSQAQCPCPRCTTPKEKFREMGTQADMDRRETLARVDSSDRQDVIEMVRGGIFENGVGVNSKAVEDVLGATSETPVRNAFSWRLRDLGLNFYQLFVVDLLHEFELGVWKAIFIHLLRILQARGQAVVHELNRRYRAVPAFGRDTIRRVHKNVSELKQLAARDYEDYLQCAIPCFDSLLPEPFNSYILTLLFTLATWHALAKLRQHTASSLSDLRDETTTLGSDVRNFETHVCKSFTTKELPRETAARSRRALAAAKKSKGKRKAKEGDDVNISSCGKSFNMNTYKYHALGDYAASIAQFGTTDNTSTQMGESEHRRVKRFAPRTGKKDYATGISKHVDRERLVHDINEKNAPLLATKRDPKHSFDESESLPPTSPKDDYNIAESQRDFDNIYKWMRDNKDDPAAKDFGTRLKDHLLRRRGYTPASDTDEFSTLEHAKLHIQNDRVYWHQSMRINYTTYNMRRAQDVINPDFRSDIFVYATDDDAHPFWYARVIGILHVNVYDPVRRTSERMEVLWARWYAFDSDNSSGWKAKRLHRVGFVPGNGEDAFGFIDPQDVVRASHLIPSFADGCTSALLDKSELARRKEEENLDYHRYYVNMFADRDMFMRYRGGGVGHKHPSSQVFLDDRIDPAVPAADSDIADPETSITDDSPVVQLQDTPQLVLQDGDVMGKVIDDLDVEFDDEFWESEDEWPDPGEILAERATDPAIEQDLDVESGYNVL